MPLHAIDSYIQLILEANQSPSVHHHVLDLQEQHSVLQQRIFTMLEIAREQQIGLTIQKINLREMKQDIDDLMSSLIKIYRCDHILFQSQELNETTHAIDFMPD